MAPLDVSLRYDHIWAPAREAINATAFVDDEGVRAADAPPVVVAAEAWSARSGKLLHSQQWSVPLASQVVTEVGKLSFVPSDADVGDTVILILEARGQNCSYPRCVGRGCYHSARDPHSNATCLLSSHSYTFGIALKGATTSDELSAPLSMLRNVNSSCVVADVHDRGSPGTSEIVVHNTSPNIAVMARVIPHDLSGMTSGDALPWTALTDNYFSLRPDEHKTVRLRQLGKVGEVSGVGVASWNAAAGGEQCY